MNGQEIEIDLKDLLLEILKKWWILCLAAILGAALLGGLQMFQASADTGSVSDVSSEEELEKAVEELREKLGDTEVQQVEQMMEELKRLEPKQAEIYERILNFDVSASSEELQQLVSAQRDLVSYRNSRLSELTADQKKYYNALQGKIEQDPAAAKDTKEEIEDPQKALIKKALIKKALIGAAAGLVLAGMALSLVYVFDGRVKTAGELKYAFRCDVLETVKPGTDAVTRQMLAEDIGIMMEQKEETVLFLAGEKDTAELQQFMEELKAGITEKNTEFTVTAGDPLSDPQALQALSAAGAVILCVALKKTGRTAVQKSLDLCRRYEKPVFGFITVQAAQGRA